MRALIVAILGLAIHAAPASSQAHIPPHTDYFTWLGWAGAETESSWRGLATGDWGVHAGGARGWGAPWAGSSNLHVHAQVQAPLADPQSWGEVATAGSTVRYRLSDHGAAAYVGADAVRLGFGDDGITTAEVNAGLMFRVPVWLPERLPLITLHGAKNIAGDDTDYARAGLLLDYKFGATRSLLLDAGHAWSGFHTARLKTHGTDLTIRLLLQKDPATTPSSGIPAFAPFVRVLWVNSNDDPNQVVVGASLYWTR